MQTMPYELKGKDVPSALVGTIIQIRIPENYAEAESLTKGGQSDVVAKFADGYVIALQGKLRTRSGKKNEDGTLVESAASLQKMASEYVYSVQADAAPRAAKPQTVANRTAQDAGAKMLERAANDPEAREFIIKNGLAKAEDIDRYIANRDAAKAAAAAPKPETPAATPAKAETPKSGNPKGGKK